MTPSPTPSPASAEPAASPATGVLTVAAAVHPGHAAAPAAAVTDGLPDVDLFDLRSLLSAEERAHLERIEAHLEEHVRPHLAEPWNTETLPMEMLPGLASVGLGELDFLGASRLFQNLVHVAIARVDLSFSALVGIHNELNIGSIERFGTEEQKQRWVPALRRFEALGAFCLTEPDHGSDIAGGVETTATPDGDGWILRGTKRWIGAGTVAAVALVWAKDVSDGEVKCFLVPTDAPGFSASKITGKTGLRIMQNADMVFDDVRLGPEALLPGAGSFDATREMLRDSRAWVGWQGVGVQQGILRTLREYALTRTQFGRPLAKFQLIQAAIAQVAGNLAAATGLMMQVQRLQDDGTLKMVHAAAAKATSTRLARESAALARDAMGGNGIVASYEMARFMGDVEAIYTYEGTQSINALLVGRALTGVSAFV
ncbi:acyl-CoA dehydrogenase family protein [Micrococcus porci]|uniref:acyl-CoA dehydrogenase family protein n=1 Tax=Micrococcus porci TaxID=2856555 RepID=UPI001CD00EF9|nr:acyl-CoA dehydrogenase family protein [Micrococcus porci]UBH24707.1 acyl-CoA dehydrogenase family protein [Micrococcus porci]